MPNLIVNCKFNPPEVRLMGTTLREATINKLDALLDTKTTTSRSPAQENVNFVYVTNPPH
eukprot:NODE_4264_length_595_cov_47.902930_g3083_i0.p1 GENE.NODE_4264_length_595_cov_47.902930_g3083_i0~~NODE_4264_length_595_cov_47.902930_g3083_i0.p1  ORF type:complete len:60 (+),score=15.15 NODE_4264_length_595_cov_47.902930_g3083_i0:63-242(+)